MFRDRSVVVLLTAVLLACSVRAQAPSPWPTVASPPATPHADASDRLRSSSAADRFVQIARELTHALDVDGPVIDQAVVLLIAAKRLDPQASGVEPLLLRLATRSTTKDYSAQILAALQSYVSEQADRAVVAEAIRYLLARQNSQDGRERVLEDLVRRIGNRNAAVDSELATALGLVMQQKADAQRAKFYFLQAYNSNKHNTLAFAKLAEVAPNEIGPAAFLEHLRLAFREKPLDAEAVRNFALYAQRLGLYQVAAEALRYGAELFRYQRPTEPLPSGIYLPWAIACYNGEGGQDICLQIAESVRRQGQFDLLLEATAARAAARLGNQQEARRLLDQAGQQAERILSLGQGQSGGVTLTRPLTSKDLAWFYCFADPNPVKALDWANKSYSVEPNSPDAGALLAYALGMNGQLEWAKPVLQSFEHNQIADIVQAQIQLVEQDKAGAISTLRTAIGKDPGSLAAEQASEILRTIGSAYVPPVDPAAMTTYLHQSLGQTLIPAFLPPAKRFEVQFGARGSELAYGADIDATVTITNRGAEPLVVTENGLFAGRIRVDARVGGDIQREISNLVVETIRTALTVQPGRSLSTSVRLSTGLLRRILLDYPQANLEIQFTLYLDPVTTPEGLIRNGIADLEPVTIVVRRPKVDVTAAYVRSRVDSLSSEQEAQKVRTSQLFTGLLREQHAMAQHGTLYPYRYAAWLPDLLRSALLKDPGLLLSQDERDWAVKVNATADLLSMPLDQGLTAAAGKNLHHGQWPVRLMTVYLLGATQGADFDRVLDWMAGSDGSDLVRAMAAALKEGRRPKLSLGSGWSPGTLLPAR
ncbi:MAG: hypothetical protein GXY19_13375 [Phycisphaerae bacterium]|nr:hypothetical protein [Phycisphaerae bacterium]